MDYTDIYFIGIGGIGMSAIARYYNFKGYRVSGYDRTPSDLTRALEEEGISVHYEDNTGLIPGDSATTLVIYTPAIPSDMKELVYVREHGYRVIKRSAMLGEISRGQRCLAVAGTHGKTTTSTLLAHILTSCGEGCTAFLGGISKNYGTNLLMSHTPTIVAEADEFDRSFLQLRPEIAVITSMDADHLDIYSDLDHVREAFREFASQTTGTVITRLGLDITSSDTKARVMRYSYDDARADFYAGNIRCDDCGYFTFDLNWPDGVIHDCRCGVPGWVNVENSIAAAAIALTYGIRPDDIRNAIATFSGVKRRFDIHLNTPDCSYIDAVFQPHLYTRTRDFADGFASALSAVDRLILLDIYPAREEPIPGVTSEIIFDRVTCPDKVMIPKTGLMTLLEKEPVDILVTFGAGDIDRFTGPITAILEKRLAQK